MKYILTRIYFLFLFISITVFSQDTAHVPPLVFSGYADAYYASYTDSVGMGNFQKFPSISPRSQQFGLNIAMLTAKYTTDNLRGVITLHYGDIPASTWPGSMNYIQEANIGVMLCKKLWLDGGFFRTHFGTEGLLPKENICSSISVCTYYEPYFEAGFKLNYLPSDKLAINLYVLNGYGIYVDNNYKKSIGALINYTFNDKFNVGYSNYIGDESPIGDSVDHLRIHQNLFVNGSFGKFKFQVGGDFCMQQNSMISDPKKSASMYAGVASVKYQCCSKFAVYARGEIFDDPNGFMGGIIFDTDSMSTGYKLSGATFGVEYKPIDNAYIRLEARDLMMDSKQEIFWWDSKARSSRMEMMVHMGISF